MPNNSQRWLSSDNAENIDLEDTRDNDMKTRKVHVDGNKHCLGKEWMLYAQ